MSMCKVQSCSQDVVSLAEHKTVGRGKQLAWLCPKFTNTPTFKVVSHLFNLYTNRNINMTFNGFSGRVGTIC